MDQRCLTSLCNVVIVGILSATMTHCLEKDLFSCNFDGNDCKWTQASQFKWTACNNSTLTDNTGPRFDHTTQQEGKGYFYYLEMSDYQTPNGTTSQRIDGEEATLTSPSIPVSTACPVTISFFYNMYGRDVGSLRAEIKDSDIVLWERHGQQQNNGRTWDQALIIVPIEIVYPRFQERALNIIGQRGSSPFGDIAIDDVRITQTMDCPDNDTYNGCDFEQDFCTWKNARVAGNDDLDWTRHEGQSPTRQFAGTNTGPVHDHTFRNNTGYYLLLESSSVRVGQYADIASDVFPANSDHCLSFWYYMAGVGVGHLRVFVWHTDLSYPRSVPAGDILWMKGFNQGDGWKEGKVTVTGITDEYRIVIRGIVGRVGISDIGLDDILILKHPCSPLSYLRSSRSTLTTLPTPINSSTINDHNTVLNNVPSLTSSTVLLECTFDNNRPCPLTQSTADDFDWQLQSGATSTMGTGPNGDHTGINGTRGQYIFVEASTQSWGHRHLGDMAILVSPLIRTSASCQVTLTFFYNMYGDEMGNLSVKIRGDEDSVLWERRGKQHLDGNTWSEAVIDFTSASNRTQFQFEIIGTRGQNFRGDIALDDILVKRDCYQNDTVTRKATPSMPIGTAVITSTPSTAHTPIQTFKTGNEQLSYPVPSSTLSQQTIINGSHRPQYLATTNRINANDDNSSHTDIGVVVGVSVGGFLAFAVLLVMALLLWKTVRKSKVVVVPETDLKTTTQNAGPSQPSMQIQLVNMCIESDINKADNVSTKPTMDDIPQA